MKPTENTPVDAGARKSRINSTIVAAGVAFGLTLGGLGVAAAQTDPGGDTTTPTEAPAAAPAETPVTGDAAERVKAAALEAVPGGTVLRVETDADGSPYEAHVRRADGTEVVVKVDESFAVTAVEEHARKGGPRGRGGQPANLLTGEAAEKATAAAQGAVEGGTVLRVQGEPDGSGYHAHVRKADGTEVVVRMDAGFDVTGTEDAPAGGPRGHRGPRPGDGTTPPTTTA